MASTALYMTFHLKGCSADSFSRAGGTDFKPYRDDALVAMVANVVTRWSDGFAMMAKTDLHPLWYPCSWFLGGHSAGNVFGSWTSFVEVQQDDAVPRDQPCS